MKVMEAVAAHWMKPNPNPWTRELIQEDLGGCWQEEVEQDRGNQKKINERMTRS